MATIESVEQAKQLFLEKQQVDVLEYWMKGKDGESLEGYVLFNAYANREMLCAVMTDGEIRSPLDFMRFGFGGNPDLEEGEAWGYIKDPVLGD